MKCNKCNGNGYVSIGIGIRGLKKCNECNGTGIVAYIKEKPKTEKEFKIDLLGQKEGLLYALDIAKKNVETLEHMIKIVDEHIVQLTNMEEIENK